MTDGLLSVTMMPESNHGSVIARRWLEFRMTDVVEGSDVVFTLRYKENKPIVVTSGIASDLSETRTLQALYFFLFKTLFNTKIYQGFYDVKKIQFLSYLTNY